MDLDKLKARIQESFDGVTIKKTFGETTFFYNPEGQFPRGIYFCTIKEADGPNDKSSQLDRDGVFRLSFKPFPETFEKFFGEKPKRPKKGGHILSQLDLATKDKWMPHAIYGWMGWTMIMSPTENSIEHIWPYIQESYELAKMRFEKKSRGPS